MTYGDTATRVLLSVIRQARPTVRSVAAEVGISTAYAHRVLRRLRAADLVRWDGGKQGTLRAMVAPVRTAVRYNGPVHTSDPRTADTAGGRTTPNQRGGAAMADDTPAPRIVGGFR